MCNAKPQYAQQSLAVVPFIMDKYESSINFMAKQEFFHNVQPLLNSSLAVDILGIIPVFVCVTRPLRSWRCNNNTVKSEQQTKRRKWGEVKK